VKSLAQIILLTALPVLLITACTEQVETVVIKDSPKSASPESNPDTIQKENDNIDTFRHIRVGESYDITSFDPLFARTPGSKRAVQLVYEGLVRLDQNGNVIPAIAKRWSITSDSLSYTFTLRDDVFYHDSQIFANGLGRKVRPFDFSFIFHRMAQKRVPPAAGQLFMSIEGFEPYFREQRNTYMPDERKQDRITGINIPDDSTIVFNLIRKDPKFLQKLASPYAVAHPREAITPDSSKLHDNPTGSGPFELSSSRSDSLYIFKKFGDYRYGPSQTKKIRADRVDLIKIKDELKMIRKFADGELDLITELAPRTLQAFINSDLELKASHNNAFNVHKGGTINYTVFFNSTNRDDLSISETAGILKNYPPSDYATTINSGAVSVKPSATLENADPQPYNGTVFTTLTEDPYLQLLYMRMSSELQKKNVDFKILNTYITNSNVHLYSRRMSKLENPTQLEQSLFTVKVEHIALSRKQLANFSLNSHSWWFDLRETGLDPLNR